MPGGDLLRGEGKQRIHVHSQRSRKLGDAHVHVFGKRFRGVHGNEGRIFDVIVAAQRILGGRLFRHKHGIIRGLRARFGRRFFRGKRLRRRGLLRHVGRLLRRHVGRFLRRLLRRCVGWFLCRRVGRFFRGCRLLRGSRFLFRGRLLRRLLRLGNLLHDRFDRFRFFGKAEGDARHQDDHRQQRCQCSSHVLHLVFSSRFSSARFPFDRMLSTLTRPDGLQTWEYTDPCASVSALSVSPAVTPIKKH